MHMQRRAGDHAARSAYEDVVAEVRDFLAARVRACIAAGIARERLCIDPGFGFGKLLAHNLQLLRGWRSSCALGLPLLVGLSRKSMRRRRLSGARRGARAATQRLAGSLALATIAVLHGARIVRAHDVAATRAMRCGVAERRERHRGGETGGQRQSTSVPTAFAAASAPSR